MENSYDIKRERGDAQFNPRNRFVSSAIWELPVGRGKLLLNNDGIFNTILGGWQLSTEFTAQSGQYLTPQFSGVDTSNTNTFGGRPDIVGNPVLPKGQRSISHWFNVAAFAVPQNGYFGNARNGSIVGPGQNALNAGLAKSFTIHKEMALSVRGSFTNVLNHPNFGNPDTNISDGPSAGVMSSTTGNSFSGARSGQVSARLSF